MVLNTCREAMPKYTIIHQFILILKFTDGEAKGTYEIRFCHYNHQGGFQRSPLIIDEKDIPKLRKALEATPKLKNMLKKLFD